VIWKDRKYIGIGEVNPIYEDYLQNRINIDNQRPIGEAVQAARSRKYSRDITEGRNTWNAIVLHSLQLPQDAIDDEYKSILTKYQKYYPDLDPKSITICRICVPDLHLFGELPQFNLSPDGKLSPEVENKVRMYPLAIKADEYLELTRGEWVNVSFLDPVNYEFAIITARNKLIPPYAGTQPGSAKEPFSPCAGDCRDASFLPDDNIQMRGQNRKRIRESTLEPSQLDNIVNNIIKSENGGHIDFFLTRAFITAESNNNPLALSSTGCAGYGQFCYDTAVTYSETFIGGSSSNKTPILYPNSDNGRIKVAEGPRGNLYEAIRSKGTSTQDILHSLSVNFFGGSTLSFAKNKANTRDSQEAKDYIKFLKTGEAITEPMKVVLRGNNIEIGANDPQTIQNLYSFLRENDPYKQFLDPITTKTGGIFVVLPVDDARFRGEDNILATFRKINIDRKQPTIKDNPYACYMWYNEGRNQKPIMREVLKKTQGALNFVYPAIDFWNNELFESINTEVSGKNRILRNSNLGAGKYVEYVRGIFPKINKEIKRLEEAYNRTINIG